ncbi:hypothetical protein CDAR_398051 [Caerostris darwini]|uniref:Uncharacterized protein n=1 Tax=Caerostris darwini TaxID=1538125 RepID=A0AAV4WRS6_9ARAC|nr:hypothetical protein CDAR_398051 [Caerostris darwini]
MVRKVSSKAIFGLWGLVENDLLVSPTAFARLGRGVLAEVAPQQKYHFAGAALKVLQRAAEDMTISSLVVMYDFTKHRNAIELKKRTQKCSTKFIKALIHIFKFKHF